MKVVKFFGAFLGITLSCLITLVLLEFAFRLMIPCEIPIKSWPTVAYPEIGNLMKPDAVVQCTNIVDYCITEKTNSLGFLDRELPAPDVLKDKLKIVFVGDSYVEAVQVNIPEKSHILLEKELNTKLNANTYAAAFGYSGMGQVQELKMLERFVQKFHPDVVVLFVLSNDMRNNSWLLQTIEDGVEPDHPFAVEIRPSFPYDGKTWSMIPPDPMCMSHPLPKPAGAEVPLPAVVQWLTNNSMLYSWAETKTRFIFPRLHAILVGGKRNEPPNPYPVRVNALRQMGDQYVSLLSDFPSDLKSWGSEYVFDRETLPSAWQMAVSATEYTMDRFVELSRRENFRVVVFITASLKRYAKAEKNEPWQFRRWVKICEDRNLPYIDQYHFLESHGYDVVNEGFSRDGHWSRQGHVWGAESLFEFFKAHPELLVKPKISPAAGHLN